MHGMSCLQAYEMKYLKENDDKLRSQLILSKLQSGECNSFCKEIKPFNPKKESWGLTVGKTSGESNIANI